METDDKQQILKSNFTSSVYESIESTFEEITDHTTFLADYIINTFTPNKEQSSLLDIGSGPAFVSQQLLNHYHDILAIDPNESYTDYYEELKRHSNFEYIIINFQDTSFSRQFTTILCSHILYHIPQNDWGTCVKKMLTLLESNGNILITLVGPKGHFHQLCHKLNPQYSNSTKLCLILDQLNIPFGKKLVEAKYKEKNLQKFTNLIRMFALDDCFLPNEYADLSDSQKSDLEDEINIFIKDSYCSSEKSYILNTHEEYIVIKKF